MLCKTISGIHSKWLFALAILFLAACSKSDSGSTTTTNTDTSKVSTVLPTIKVYNVMDYGPVNVSINKTNLGDVAQYFPTAYKQALIGENNVSVSFGGLSALNQNINLLANNSYSMFIYRVAYNWKTSLVKDDLLTKPSSGNAFVRVLDFRTQAYVNYVSVRFYSPGNVPLDYTSRNFLDHESYNTYTAFKTIPAGTYTITIFNSSDNLMTVSNVAVESGKTYTMVMMTQASKTPGEALKDIRVDFQANQ